MNVSWFRMSCLGILLAASTMGALAQTSCVTCGLDDSVSNGFIASHPKGQCLVVPPTQDCHVSLVTQNIAYINEFHPEFVLASRAGHLYVSKILNGSGANRVDIRVGDEIIAINNENTSVGAPQRTWAADSSSRFADLEVRRGEENISVSVPLVQVKDLLKNEWESEPAITNASISLPHSVPKPTEATIPFSAGIEVREQEAEIVVSAVLHGSSAYRNGVRPGDQIVLINGLALAGKTMDAAEAMLNGFAKESVVLDIRQKNRKRTVTLSLDGVNEILDRIAPSSPSQTGSTLQAKSSL